MALQLLLELLDTTSAESPDVKRSRSRINHVAQLLFKQDAGPVKDLKRSKEAKFFGVANVKSVLVDSKENRIRLTFDNSTDSGEFEINSLVPLGIAKGSPEDKAIKALYRDLEIESSKRVGYVISGDQTLVREIHLGKTITGDTVRMIKGILKLLKVESEEEDKPEGEEKSKKKEVSVEREDKKPVEKKPVEKKPVEQKEIKKPVKGDDRD